MQFVLFLPTPAHDALKASPHCNNGIGSNRFSSRPHRPLNPDWIGFTKPPRKVVLNWFRLITHAKFSTPCDIQMPPYLVYTARLQFTVGRNGTWMDLRRNASTHRSLGRGRQQNCDDLHLSFILDRYVYNYDWLAISSTSAPLNHMTASGQARAWHNLSRPTYVGLREPHDYRLQYDYTEKL